MPSHSYLSQSELPVTFGLGADERIEELSVTWPAGNTQKLQSAGIDRLITVREENP
jgi:hypothetical protein